jgi:predicted RNase H-like nuclease (RuvC/YqgF family)
LQSRIETQEKYLHSLLTKAQEILSGYSNSSQSGKTELSELISVVETEYRTSKQSQNTDCSTDSCLTSSEKLEMKNEVSDSERHRLKRKMEVTNGVSSLDRTGDGKRIVSLSVEKPGIDLNR